jgi:hypothetical protein
MKVTIAVILLKQEGQVTYNVILGRVRLIIVAVEEQ